MKKSDFHELWEDLRPWLVFTAGYIVGGLTYAFAIHIGAW